MLLGQALVHRIEMTGATIAAAMAAPLQQVDDSRKCVVLPLGGGQAVLLGQGMYVNRLLGAGLGVNVTHEDLEQLEAAASEVGVAAEIDACPWALPTLLETATARGYAAGAWTTSLARAVASGDLGDHDLSTNVDVSEAASEADVTSWQEASASGFGCTTQAQRIVSDLWARACSKAPSTTLYLARLEGRVVGSASLTVQSGVATLGGMSTVPTARRLGVQAALIRARLHASSMAGADLAVTTAAPGGASERNLIRHGFDVIYTNLRLRQLPNVDT